MVDKKTVDGKEKLLDIELLQVAEFLFGRVMGQDETLRSATLNYEHDGVLILSAGTPQLYLDGCKKVVLYIRGSDRRNDHMTMMYRFKTEKEATKWGEKIKAAVEAFNIDPENKSEVPTEPLRCKRIMG